MRAGSLMLSILMLGLFWAPGAEAGTGLTIQPIKVSHTINPGDSVSDTISLTKEARTLLYSRKENQGKSPIP